MRQYLRRQPANDSFSWAGMLNCSQAAEFSVLIKATRRRRGSIVNY